MNAAFWRASAERAVRTFAQAFVAYIGTAGATDLSFDWVEGASVSGLATLLSLLTSVAASRVGGAGPSLANEVTSPPAPPIGD
jgi:hypothetical protein